MLSITDGKEVDWANMPLPKVAYGNALDTDFTLKLHGEMYPQVKLSKKLHDTLLKRVLVTFARMERKGLHICRKELGEARVYSERNLEKLRYTLSELLKGTSMEGEEVNFNSGKQLVEILFGAFDLPCYAFTDKGMPKTSADALENILSKTKGVKKHANGREFITKLLEYKAAEKIHKTYINGIEKAIDYNQEDRVYRSYNIGEVVTGRLSCSRYNAGRKAPKGEPTSLKQKSECSHNVRGTRTSFRRSLTMLTFTDSLRPSFSRKTRPKLQVKSDKLLRA
jgi:DNA polymerase I-like protein with 3'-5' exonuclease and polymerase domains